MQLYHSIIFIARLSISEPYCHHYICMIQIGEHRYLLGSSFIFRLLPRLICALVTSTPYMLKFMQIVRRSPSHFKQIAKDKYLSHLFAEVSNSNRMQNFLHIDEEVSDVKKKKIHTIGHISIYYGDSKHCLLKPGRYRLYNLSESVMAASTRLAIPL